jgi:hypothetical protein
LCLNLIHMKKITLQLFLAAFFPILFCFATCLKGKVPPPDNPYGLPNATETGNDVFACRINGANYVSTGGLGYGAFIQRDTVAARGGFKVGHNFYELEVGFIGNVQENISYSLADTVHTFCQFYTDSICHPVTTATFIYPRIGSITLTKRDTVNQIISGIFEVQIPVPDCDTLNVTYGRFDMQN